MNCTTRGHRLFYLLVFFLALVLFAAMKAGRRVVHVRISTRLFEVLKTVGQTQGRQPSEQARCHLEKILPEVRNENNRRLTPLECDFGQLNREIAAHLAVEMYSVLRLGAVSSGLTVGQKARELLWVAYESERRSL